METLVRGFVSHNIQNRIYAIIENGTWAATSGELIREQMEKLKNSEFIETDVSLKSSLKECQLCDIDAMAHAIVDTVPKNDKTAGA